VLGGTRQGARARKALWESGRGRRGGILAGNLFSENLFERHSPPTHCLSITLDSVLDARSNGIGPGGVGPRGPEIWEGTAEGCDVG